MPALPYFSSPFEGSPDFDELGKNTEFSRNLNS